MTPRFVRAQTTLLVSLAIAGLGHFAAADGPANEGFRFERELVPSRAGASRIDVDVALLAGAEPGGGLRDLRIAME